MKSTRRIYARLAPAFVGLSLMSAAPCLAQDASASAAVEDAQPVSAEKQALANTVADILLPQGIYERMMREQMQQVADAMVGSMLGLDANMLAAMAGPEGSEERAELEAEMGDASFEELMADYDPHFRERMSITMKVMFEEMAPLMSAMEPQIREALSTVYARQYDAQELSDMLAFFRSDSGEAFASNFMTLFFGQELMDASMAMMEAMPQIMEKVEKATAHLPAPVSPDASDAPVSNDAGGYTATGDYPTYWSEADIARAEAVWTETEQAYARYDEIYETIDAEAKVRVND